MCAWNRKICLEFRILIVIWLRWTNVSILLLFRNGNWMWVHIMYYTGAYAVRYTRAQIVDFIQCEHAKSVHRFVSVGPWLTQFLCILVFPTYKQWGTEKRRKSVCVYSPVYIYYEFTFYSFHFCCVYLFLFPFFAQSFVHTNNFFFVFRSLCFAV